MDLTPYVRPKGDPSPSPCLTPEGLRRNLVTGERIGAPEGYTGWLAVGTWRGRSRVFAVVADQAYNTRKTFGFRSKFESGYGIRYHASCKCSALTDSFPGYITFLEVVRASLDFVVNEPPEQGPNYDNSETASLLLGVSYQAEGYFFTEEGFRFEVIRTNILRDSSGTFDDNWKPTVILGDLAEVRQWVNARSGEWSSKFEFEQLLDAWRYAQEGSDPYDTTCESLGLAKHSDGLFGDICRSQSGYDHRNHYGKQLLLSWPQRTSDAYWCGGEWGGQKPVYQNPCENLVPEVLTTCQPLVTADPDLTWVRKPINIWEAGGNVDSLVGVEGIDTYDVRLERPPEFLGARLESVEFIFVSVGACPDGWIDCGDCCLNCCEIGQFAFDKFRPLFKV